MEADSTFNEPEPSMDDNGDEPSSPLTPNPLRPPRPTKRAGALARMPMPSPASRNGGHPFGATEDLFDSAPASPPVPIEDDDADGPAFPLEASRVRAPSPLPLPKDPLPEESFADIAHDGDHAPSAPLTPWRDVPRMVAAPDSEPGLAPEPELAEAAPIVERNDPDSSPPVGIDPEEDREDTIVGEVNRSLLEMSGSGDENTRAYTAPQELIELAKRKREERLRAKSAVPVSPEAHSKETARPPAQRRAAGGRPSDERLEELVSRAAALSPSGPSSDAAPAIARASSGPPPDRPAAVLGSERISSAHLELATGSRPSLAASAPAVSAERARGDVSPESVAMSISNYKTPWLRTPPRWVLIAVVFVVVGFVLSRWRGIEQLIEQLIRS